MLSWPGRLAVTLFAACLLAGCQPAAPSPTPVPTYACTPEAGGAEFSCSQQQYDEMVAKDKLYAEAEAVYRRFLNEEIAVLRLGGADEPTVGLTQTTGGEFLKEVMGDMRHAKEQGIAVDRGSRGVRAVQRLPGKSKGGSLVALRVCVDSTSVHFVRNGKSAGNGAITQDDLYFANERGALKVIGADGKAVEKC